MNLAEAAAAYRAACNYLGQAQTGLMEATAAYQNASDVHAAALRTHGTAEANLLALIRGEDVQPKGTPRND